MLGIGELLGYHPAGICRTLVHSAHPGALDRSPRPSLHDLAVGAAPDLDPAHLDLLVARRDAHHLAGVRAVVDVSDVLEKAGLVPGG